MADISKIKLPNGTSYDLKDARRAPQGPNEILNAFAPEKENNNPIKVTMIDRLENAFYFADKRWSVTGTKTDSDGNQTALSTGDIAQLFSMGERDTQNVPISGSLVVTIDFTGSSGTEVFKNYPYGYVYLNFYYHNIPESVSVRVYGKHTGSTSYWTDLTTVIDSRSTTGRFRYIAQQTSMYNMQKLEVTVRANSSIAASLMQINYYLVRGDLNHDMPYVSKLRAETLYYPMTAPNFIGKINNHTINSDVPANAKFTDTTYTAQTTSIGSASAGTAISADDITAWTTNTPTAVTKKTVVTAASGATASYANGILTITNGSFTTGDSVSVTAGTAASLSYTAKSIPNISVTSKTVATGITAN